MEGKQWLNYVSGATMAGRSLTDKFFAQKANLSIGAIVDTGTTLMALDKLTYNIMLNTV